jgi:hypothetical protein
MKGVRAWIAAAAALPALAVGCGGTETTTAAGGASIVPAGVPAFVAFDSNPDSSQWQTFDQLASKFPDKQKGIDAIKKEMRDDGLDWERDVKPALGPEVDIVWLDFANRGENLVVLMQPDDQGAFERAIKKSNANDPGDKAIYETFRGWTVMSDKQALIDRFKTMSDAADETLDQDPAFTKAMKSTPGEALAKAYVDGRKVIDEVNRQTTPDQKKFVQQLGSLDWATASLAASSDGIAFDTTGEFAVHYADVDGKLVVTDVPAGIAGVKNPGKPLADSATYKDALRTSGMPSKTHGFLYVDIKAGTGLVESLSGTPLAGEISRNLKPLRSAVEYAVSRQHQLSVRFFLRIK